MSIIKTFDTDSRDNFDTDSCKAPRPLGENEKRSAAATRLRLPNKTQWSLAYMLKIQETAREQMEVILRWTEEERCVARSRVQLSRLDHLSELEHAVALLALCNARLERALHDCRAGVYNGPVCAEEK